jgi:hypothetical protein
VEVDPSLHFTSLHGFDPALLLETPGVKRRKSLLNAEIQSDPMAINNNSQQLRPAFPGAGL